jgi:nucleoside-diphosphate-sugar epimerase
MGAPASTILVTGATGLVGSNLCQLAVEAGHGVRAMVRSPAAAAPLEAIGAEAVTGDITDQDSIRRAAKGADGIIHTAAVLGGTWASSTPEEFFRINYEGSVVVLDVARDEGLPIVLLSSYGILVCSETMTEISKPWPIGSQSSPYIKAKIAAFYEGMARAAAGTQTVSFVFPGCIYGPSLFGERALDPTSFDSALLRGLTGELKQYVRMLIPWSYSLDVATVTLRALLRGRTGQSYLVLGRPGEVMSLAEFCNVGASIAGVEHRVEDEDPRSNPEKYGTMGQHAQKIVAEPLFDSSVTNAELGVEPTSLEDGLTATISWFRGLGKL